MTIPIDLALDFANTFGFDRGRLVDRLKNPPDWMAWLAKAGLLQPPWTETLRGPTAVRSAWDEALRLRVALWALMDARAAGTEPPPEAVAAFNRALAWSAPVHRLSPADGQWSLLEMETCTRPEGVSAAIARSAAVLLAEVDPGRLRRCDAQDCREWFVDTSKGGRRRWCSMARCGNRRKAARHRARQAAD